jgi:hypothetical protein
VIGPAANATSRATDKDFMRFGERLRTQDSLPLACDPQTATLSLSCSVRLDRVQSASAGVTFRM